MINTAQCTVTANDASTHHTISSTCQLLLASQKSKYQQNVASKATHVQTDTTTARRFE